MSFVDFDYFSKIIYHLSFFIQQSNDLSSELFHVI